MIIVFQPLRNRKGGIEQQDGNEYVLNKPKRESGKPSKHQLRKLKELAKKEKVSLLIYSYNMQDFMY